MFYKKKLLLKTLQYSKHSCFSVNIVKFLRTPISKTPANNCFCKFQNCRLPRALLYLLKEMPWLLEFVTWANWVSTGSNWMPRILSSIFSREVFQISGWKYLFCIQQEAFGVFIFPYFVLSWYILAQSLVKTFPKWKYIFSFFFL